MFIAQIHSHSHTHTQTDTQSNDFNVAGAGISANLSAINEAVLWQWWHGDGDENEVAIPNHTYSVDMRR